AVHQELRDGARQHDRLVERRVVVRPEGDGLGAEVGEHLLGERGEARLGVAHGGRGVAVERPEVPLAVDERVAEGEGLRHAPHRPPPGPAAGGILAARAGKASRRPAFPHDPCAAPHACNDRRAAPSTRNGRCALAPSLLAFTARAEGAQRMVIQLLISTGDPDADEVAVSTTIEVNTRDPRWPAWLVDAVTYQAQEGARRLRDHL